MTRDLWGHRELIERERLEMEVVFRISKGLVHSCSNALQVTLSGLEMLALESRGNPEALGLIQHIKDSQESLRRLLAKFMEYSSPFRLDPRPGHLGEILEESWAQLIGSRRGRQVRLGAGASPPDLRCTVDRTATERLYRSILEFFLQSCPGMVEIQVQWSSGQIQEREAVVLELRNSALELHPWEKAEIFEPFAKTRAGVSLNLALARRIAVAQGGGVALVEIADGSPPDGLAIRVLLPRQPLSVEAEDRKIEAPREEFRQELGARDRGKYDGESLVG